MTEKLLMGEKYFDFAPILAAEKLEELNGIKIHHKTLRRLRKEMPD
ncbi:MAG: hypothetical protein P1P63_02760 [Treponemataceae bacterium]